MKLTGSSKESRRSLSRMMSWKAAFSASRSFWFFPSVSIGTPSVSPFFGFDFAK
jgi:hypothetical protein